MQLPRDGLGVLAPAVAVAADAPNPKNTVFEPAFKTRYWQLPPLFPEICTGVGDGLAAVITTVFPVGVNGALTDMIILVLVALLQVERPLLLEHFEH